MASSTVFISYRHEVPSTLIATEFYKALRAVRDHFGFDLFMDKSSIEPGDRFVNEILDGLNRTTHFLALLDVEYWSSDYCRKELDHVLARWEKGEDVRILFVKAGEIKPEWMKLKREREAEGIRTEAQIERIGDLQFLGPFDGASRLIRLKHENIGELRDQIGDLVKELARVLPGPR
jgi:TIR domain